MSADPSEEQLRPIIRITRKKSWRDTTVVRGKWPMLTL
jgi:hypothetical protein